MPTTASPAMAAALSSPSIHHHHQQHIRRLRNRHSASPPSKSAATITIAAVASGVASAVTSAASSPTTTTIATSSGAATTTATTATTTSKSLFNSLRHSRLADDRPVQSPLHRPAYGSPRIIQTLVQKGHEYARRRARLKGRGEREGREEEKESTKEGTKEGVKERTKVGDQEKERAQERAQEGTKERAQERAKERATERVEAATMGTASEMLAQEPSVAIPKNPTDDKAAPSQNAAQSTTTPAPSSAQDTSPSHKRRASADETPASAQPPSVQKRQRPDAAPPRTLPARYEKCPDGDLVVLIADMINELIETNDSLALCSGSLTRFHSRTAPAISVLDYLGRLTRHATLTPPILLAMVFYIDRLCAYYSEFTINTLTVHRFLITAATVAAKGLLDSYWTNATYARVGGVRPAELRLLELEFLYRVDWRIVPADEVLMQYYQGLVARHPGYVLEEEKEEGEEKPEPDGGEGVGNASGGGSVGRDASGENIVGNADNVDVQPSGVEPEPTQVQESTQAHAQESMPVQVQEPTTQETTQASTPQGPVQAGAVDPSGPV